MTKSPAAEALEDIPPRNAAQGHVYSWFQEHKRTIRLALKMMEEKEHE